MRAPYVFAFTTLLAAVAGTTAQAQVPPNVAAVIREIGANPETRRTSEAFASIQQDRAEPYANVRVTRDVAYGQDPLQKLDVFAPAAATTNAPVLIYVHGGGYLGGDKRERYQQLFYDNIMLWATKNGMVGVNVNYRLAPKDKYPAADEDVATAIRWARDNIAQHGGNPRKIFLMGQSAGGSIVATHLSYLRFQIQAGVPLAGAIILSGLFDENTFRLTPYFDVDTQNMIASKFTVEGLKASTVPLFIGYSEFDVPENTKHNEELIAALCAARNCPTMTARFRDHNHYSHVFSFNSPDESVSGPVLSFIRNVP